VASDEAARSLATADQVRLPSGSELSISGGSRMLGLTYPAMRDSLLVFRSEGEDVLGADVSLSGPTAKGWVSSTGDGEGMIASSSSMGWSH
jgi:hypothetical protein